MKRFLYYIIIMATLQVACTDSKQQANEHASHDHGHDDDDDHDHQDKELAENEVAFTTQQAAAIGLETHQAQLDTFYQVIKTVGQILPSAGDEVTIAAPANGLLSYAQQHIVEGVSVTAGRTLATISAKHLTDGDPQAKTRLQYETAQREFQRAEMLLSESLISQKAYEQARLAYETAKVAHDALSATQTTKGVAISSSINGYIKNRLVNEGEYVSTGQPIVTVTQNKRLRLRAEVSEKYYKYLPFIRNAHFKTPYDDNIYVLDQMGGQLLSYGRATDGQSLYVPITFELDNTGALISGAFAEVYLLAQPMAGVISVPLGALLEEQGIHYVYLQRNNTVYQKQEVTRGEDDGNDVVILSGLKEGDQVVTKGAYHLKLASLGTAIPHGHSH